MVFYYRVIIWSFFLLCGGSLKEILFGVEYSKLSCFLSYASFRFSHAAPFATYEHTLNLPVPAVMDSTPVALPARGMSLHYLQNLLDMTAFRGFPVVGTRNGNHITGYIGSNIPRGATEHLST